MQDRNGIDAAPPRMTALVDARSEPHISNALALLGFVAVVLVADGDGDVAIGKVAQDDKLRALVNSLRAFSKATWVEAVHRVWVADDDAADEIMDAWRARFEAVKLGGSGRRWFAVDVEDGVAAMEACAAAAGVVLMSDRQAYADARGRASQIMRRMA